MRLDRISTTRGSLSELPRRDHLDTLKKINAEYLAHFKAFAARSQEWSDISYELQAQPWRLVIFIASGWPCQAMDHFGEYGLAGKILP